MKMKKWMLDKVKVRTFNCLPVILPRPLCQPFNAIVSKSKLNMMKSWPDHQ